MIGIEEYKAIRITRAAYDKIPKLQEAAMEMCEGKDEQLLLKAMGPGAFVSWLILAKLGRRYDVGRLYL